MTPPERGEVTSPRPIGLWVSAIGLTVFLVRVVVPVWSDGVDLTFPDSFSFLTVADRGPFWPRFWFDERPVGMPLVYWAVGRSARVLVVVQSVAYALAAIGLCSVLLRVLRNRAVAGATCAVVVLVCVRPELVFWSTDVLSESLGLTTGLAALALWLAAAARPRPRALRWATAATVGWMLVRDAHVLPAIVVVVPALVVVALLWRSSSVAVRRSLLGGAAVILVVGLYVTVSQDVSGRNRYPVMNDIGQRVLPDPAMTQWFVDGGMPLDAALVERTGHSSFDDGYKMLEDPELATFRAWAEGPGQRRLVLSFALKPGFWLSRFGDDLPGVLMSDFRQYDRHGVGERTVGGGWLTGPRTPAQLVLWTSLSLAGLAACAAARHRRGVALVVALALASAWVEMYLSYAGDSLEVQRHLIGPLLRLVIAMVLAIALGVDALVASTSRRVDVAHEVPAMVRPRRRDVSSSALVGLATAALAAALFRDAARSPDVDPQFARTIVERAARFGGTYYSNGIHNKGPLELLLHDLARAMTSWDSYWYGIAAVVVLIALTVGLACGVVSHALGANRWVAGAVGAGVAVHLTLSGSDYAGVLYARNITSALLAMTFALALVGSAWRSPRRSAVSLTVCGLLLGLAVQTLLTAALTAVVVGGFVAVHRGGRHRIRAALQVMTIALATVLIAPAWYAVRGSWAEFWSGWWTYASFMSSGTGRSLASQAGLGWTSFLGYVQDRPELVAVVVGFVVMARARWARLGSTARQIHVAVVSWMVAAWVELVLSQRYSSHYFSIVAVPAALMVACLAAHLDGAARAPASTSPRAQRWRTSAAAPLLAVGAVLVLQCSSGFWQGLTAAGSFRGPAVAAADRDAQRSGSWQAAQAVLDLVSRDDDPLVAWTMYPWTYLDHRRVPATRFSWKSFLRGEIYLGRTDPRYVLAETEEWFEQDMAQSDPAALLVERAVTYETGTPFDALMGRYGEVYGDDDVTISLRDDVRDSVVGPVRGVPWEPPDSSNPGWSVASGSARSDGAAEDAATGRPAGGPPLGITGGGCLRIGATVTLDDGPPPSGLLLRLVPLDGRSGTVSLGYDGAHAWSAADDAVLATADVTRSGDAVVTGATPTPLVLVVGSRAAALVIDGRIVAAARLSGPVGVLAVATGGPVTLADVVVGPPPEAARC